MISPIVEHGPDPFGLFCRVVSLTVLSLGAIFTVVALALRYRASRSIASRASRPPASPDVAEHILPPVSAAAPLVTSQIAGQR